MGAAIGVVVAETSAIIRCGVVSLLSRIAESNLVITEVDNISTLVDALKKESSSILIINPLYLGLISPAHLRKEVGSDRLKIVALQSSLIDGANIEQFDEIITLRDDLDCLRTKISNLLQAENNLAKDAKKELTAREKDVIVCVVKGMSNKQIAESLFLSTHTIITHRRNIAAKLQINSAAGLTIYAIVNKLVDISEI